VVFKEIKQKLEMHITHLMKIIMKVTQDINNLTVIAITRQR